MRIRKFRKRRENGTKSVVAIISKKWLCKQSDTKQLVKIWLTVGVIKLSEMKTEFGMF